MHVGQREPRLHRVVRPDSSSRDGSDQRVELRDQLDVQDVGRQLRYSMRIPCDDRPGLRVAERLRLEHVDELMHR